MTATAPNLAPRGRDMPALPLHELELVAATEDNLSGYGRLVDDASACDIEIVRWPAQGWRPVDLDTGDQGGTTEGVFDFRWRGQTLHAHNASVPNQNEYVLGWSCEPWLASDGGPPTVRDRVLLWHANYHPDGGQMFFPREPGPFVSPLALPGDDIGPASFVTFWFSGEQGLYIHPGVWHEAVFPVNDSQRFFDKQGRVHARVSIDFARECGCYLSVPLRAVP